MIGEVPAPAVTGACGSTVMNEEAERMDAGLQPGSGWCARAMAGAGPDADDPSPWVARWLPEVAAMAGRGSWTLPVAGGGIPGWPANADMRCWRWTGIRPVLR